MEYMSRFIDIRLHNSEMGSAEGENEAASEFDLFHEYMQRIISIWVSVCSGG